MAYIDIKHTVWQRYEINEEHLEKFLKLDEKQKHQAVFHDLVDNATEIDWLFDTSEYLSPSDNGNQPTVEVYSDRHQGGKLLWDNQPIDIKRQKKIEEIQKF